MGKSILFLALVAAIAGTFAFRHDLEARKHDLAEARVLIKNAKDNVTTKETQLGPKKQENQDIRAKIDRFTELDTAKQALNSQLPMLEQARTDVVREYKEAVEQVRAASAGIAWADITLPSGQVLKSVTIQKVAESDVTFAHSGGVSRVAAADLPADLVDRFKYGKPPMVMGQTPFAPAAQPGSTTPAVPTQPGTAVPTPAPSAAPAAVPPSSAATSPKIMEMEQTVRSLETQLAEYNRTQGLYQSQVQAYRLKDDELRQSGMKPQHSKVIPKLDAALRELSAKMGELNTRIGNLKVEIENAKATPS